METLRGWLMSDPSQLAAYIAGGLGTIALGLMAYNLPKTIWGKSTRAVSLSWDWTREHFGKYALPVKWFKNWKRARAKAMGQRKALERFWVDVICNAGENAVHSGQFSRDQINQWYILFGKRLNLTELLPKQFLLTKQDQRDLKGAIMKRIGPEARQAFKQRQKAKRTTTKAIRNQFRRSFKNVAA